MTPNGDRKDQKMRQNENAVRLPIFDDVSEAVALRVQTPRNYGPPTTWNGRARITGPCGDTMEFWIEVLNDRIVRLGFTTDGCGYSRAAGSMAGELALGSLTAEANTIEQKDVLDALDGLPPEHVHCALLAANTLKAAISNFVEES